MYHKGNVQKAKKISVCLISNKLRKYFKPCFLCNVLNGLKEEHYLNKIALKDAKMCIYAATLYIVEFVSSAWDRTSLVKMSRCRIHDQHMSWHFMATLPWQFNGYSKRIIEL